MRISTRGRYGLRFVLDLAEQDGLNVAGGRERGDSVRPVSLKDIAKRQSISEKYLWQLANTLRRAGLITVSRGARGGFALARRPEAITLKELLSVLEGNECLVDCTSNPNCCPRSTECTARNVWSDLESRITEIMLSINIKDILERESKRRREMNLDWTI